MKIVRSLLSAVATLGLLCGLLLVTPAAEAATGSVSIGTPAVSHAMDKASKGSITTPRVTTSGKAKIKSRSYVIIKGSTTVATTSTVGKKIALPIGTYRVLVTVKYKVGKKKRTATKSFTVSIVNSPRMSYAEYNQIKPNQTLAQVTAIVGSRGSVTAEGSTPECSDPDDESTCVEVLEQIRQWQTASSYGVGMVYFVNGKVGTDDYKYYVA